MIAVALVGAAYVRIHQNTAFAQVASTTCAMPGRKIVMMKVGTPAAATLVVVVVDGYVRSSRGAAILVVAPSR